MTDECQPEYCDCDGFCTGMCRVRRRALDYFDRVFCINQDCRPERWARTQRDLAQLGLAKRVERFPAIEYPADPEHGCMLSHKAVVAKAHAEGARNVLIFEDDIRMYGTEQAAKAVDELQALSWDTFYLGGYPSRRRVSMRTGAAPHSQNLCRLHGGYLCCHAIAVNASLFAEYPEATQPIDRWHAYTVQPRGRSFVVRQLVVGQRDGYSALRKEHRRRGFIKNWHDKMVKRARC